MKQQKVIAKLRSELEDLRSKYGSFILKQKDDAFVISGNLSFEGSYKGVTISNDFDIEIFATCAYPDSSPRVREVGGKIPNSFHKYSNNFLCLGFPLAVNHKFSKKPDLAGFIENLVVPYLYSFSYYQKYEKMPFGDLSHYELGIFEFYMESFAVYDKDVILAFLKILSEENDSLNILCPCKSGQKFSSCHGKVISELKKFRTPQEFHDDYHKLEIFLDSDSIKLQINTKLLKKYQL